MFDTLHVVMVNQDQGYNIKYQSLHLHHNQHDIFKKIKSYIIINDNIKPFKTDIKKYVIFKSKRMLKSVSNENKTFYFTCRCNW